MSIINPLNSFNPLTRREIWVLTFFVTLNCCALVLPIETMFGSSNKTISTTIENETVAQVVKPGATNVIADYTPIGGVITWSEPTDVKLIKGYRVEASYDQWVFKVVATVAVGQTSVEIDKVDTPHSTAFRVVTIYSDDEVFSETSPLKGQYAPLGR